MSRVQEHFVSMSVLNRMAAHRRLDRRHDAFSPAAPQALPEDARCRSAGTKRPRSDCYGATRSDFLNSASLGLEPRQRDPESLVLPLHHEATSEKIKTDLPCCKSSVVALARDLGGWSFGAEQDLSALTGRFHFQGLPALFHQRARVFHHFIDHPVVMIRIVMEKQELAHIRIKRQ